MPLFVLYFQFQLFGAISFCTGWGVRKRVVSKRVVLADVPETPKTGTRAQKNRNEGTKKRNDGTKKKKNGKRAHSPKPPFINNVHTRCIVKTSGFTRGFVKIGDFLKLKGFLAEFQESEDFSLLVAFLLVTFSWFFRGFFVAFSWPSSV